MLKKHPEIVNNALTTPRPPSKMHFLEMYSNSPQILTFLALGLFLKSAKIKILT